MTGAKPTAAAKPAVTPVVILSDRTQITAMVRSSLKALKFTDESILETKDADQALKHVGEGMALGVVDWELGVGPVLSFLNKAGEHRDKWSVFLMANAPSDKILAAGREFGVAQIHTGEISPAKIKIVVERAVKILREVTPLKKLMIEINNARKNNEWQKSTLILEKLFSQDKTNVRIAAELAENYFHEGRFADAVQMLDPFKTVQPADVRIMHILGRCLTKLGKAEEACQILTRAKLINPYNVDRLIDLGNVLLSTNNIKEAEANFNEAANFSPGLSEAIQGQGTCKLAEGEINEALSLLEDRVSGRELASVFNTAAVINIRMGKHADGMKLYEVAEKSLGDDKQILSRLFYNKGIGFYRWNKLAEARTAFEKSLEYDPTFTNSKHNIAAIDKKSGKTPAAPVAAVPKASPTPTAAPVSPPADVIPENLESFNEGLGTDLGFGDIKDDDDELFGEDESLRAS